MRELGVSSERGVGMELELCRRWEDNGVGDMVAQELRARVLCQSPEGCSSRVVVDR